VHLGGPRLGQEGHCAWFVPKGEINSGEDELAAARREFQEETGLPPGPDLIPLGSVKHKSGKKVTAWGFPGRLRSNSIAQQHLSNGMAPALRQNARVSGIDRGAFFHHTGRSRKKCTQPSSRLSHGWPNSSRTFS